MNVLVFLSGIVDTKWPLPSALDVATLAAQRAAHPVLSPFDEAALESALKLRDVDPLTHITVIVGAASRDDPLLRHVAGFRIDRLLGFELARWPAWDAAALARALDGAVQALDKSPHLLLIGREFGDLDDGTLPATLAETLGVPFASLVLALTATEDGTFALRQHGATQEHLQLPVPALAAVTNHSRNRLRHPLLKNVMAARKMSFDLQELSDDSHAAALRLDRVTATVAPAREAACRMLAGGLEAQAEALARLLLAPRVAA